MLAVDLIVASWFKRRTVAAGVVLAVASLASLCRAQSGTTSEAEQAKHLAGATTTPAKLEKKPRSALEACVTNAFVGARMTQPFRTDFMLPGDGRVHVDSFTR